MKIVAEIQTNKCGGEFLDQHEETIEIFESRGNLVIEREDEQIILPVAAVMGIIPTCPRMKVE